MSSTYQPNIHARGHHVMLEKDLITILLATFCLLCVRWLLLKISLRPFAKRMMGYKDQNLDASEALGVEKFCKYEWHYIVYIVLLCWGIILMLQSEWSVFVSGQLDNVAFGYPHDGSEKPALKAFFIAQISWYAHGLVESLMVDRSRSDFYMMLVHHVLAMALLSGSFWGNAHRVAITICVSQVRNILHISRVSARWALTERDSIPPHLAGRI